MTRFMWRVSVQNCSSPKVSKRKIRCPLVTLWRFICTSSVEGSGEGSAYLIARRVERSVAEVADQVAAELAEAVHARLSDCAVDAVLNPPQNRELSGHEGDMLLNGAYLVETDRTAELRDLLAEMEQRHGDLGARLELTGPWPPYNFVSRVAGAPA